MDRTHQSRHTLRVYVFPVREVDGNGTLDQVSYAVLERPDKWVLLPDILEERLLCRIVANYVRSRSFNTSSRGNEASRWSLLPHRYLQEITISS